MNDPNGLVVEGGRLHVFFQHEPDSPRWGRMRWGHAVTADLVSWEHLPTALEPSPDGPDALGCWSGCIVRDDTGGPVAFYTGVVLDQGLRRASICMARGDPSLTYWTKEPLPVIAAPPAGIAPDMFRDPFVWRSEHGWEMAVGAGTTAGRGRVLHYRSKDLLKWTDVGPLLTTEALVDACPDLEVAEIDSACWECPQVARIGDLICLIVSIVDRSPIVRPAHVVAVTGQMVSGSFVPMHAERLDLGPDFYAPATLSLPDGRVLLFGWIPEDPPGPDEERTWAGAMTLPRVVSLAPAGRPRISLADEVDDIGETIARWADIEVRDDEPWLVMLAGAHAELRMEIEPRGVPLRLDVLANGTLVAEVRFDPRSLRLAATRIGRVMVAGLSPTGAATLPPGCADRVDLRLIIDGSILELVAADVVTATVRLPASVGGRTISCTTFGGRSTIRAAELRTLESRRQRKLSILSR